MASNPSTGAIVDSPVLTLEGNILWQFENLSAFGAQTLKLQVAQAAWWFMREADRRYNSIRRR